MHLPIQIGPEDGPKETVMADDMGIRNPLARSRIDTELEPEVRYRTPELGVSAEQLRQAVQRVR